MVATQDRTLRGDLGHMPGIPIIYANKVSVVLEPPSNSSKQFGQGIESTKAELSRSEASVVEVAVKASAAGAVVVGDGGEGAAALAEEAAQKQRVKRKATAANPLSSAAPDENSAKSKKRKTNKFKN